MNNISGLKISSAIFLVILLSCSCEKKNPLESLMSRLRSQFAAELSQAEIIPSTSADTLGILKVQDAHHAAIDVDVLSFTEIDTSELIGRVDKLLAYEGRYYILDIKTNSVFIISDAGEMIKRIHDVGKGPHEYIHLGDLMIDSVNQTMLLYDRQRAKLLTYTLDGLFLKSKKLKFRFKSGLFLGSALWVYNMSPPYNEAIEFSYFRTNNINEKSISVLKKAIPYQSKVDKLRHRISASPFFWCYNNNISSILPFNDTIYGLSDSSINARYVIDYGELEVPDEFYELSSKEFSEARKQIDCAYNLNGIFETKDFLGVETHGYIDNEVHYKTLMIDKNSEELYYGQLRSNEYGMLISYPRANISNDTLITFLYPYTVMSSLKESEKLRSELGHINEFDNPVLVKFVIATSGAQLQTKSH